MPSQVIVKHPNWFKLMKNAKTIDLKVNKFELSMDFDDKVYDLLNKNPVYQQRLWDAGTKEWKKLLVSLDGQLKSAESDLEDAVDQYAGGLLENEKKSIIKDTEAKIGTLIARGELDMINAVDKEWAKIKKQQKLSGRFKFVTGLKAVGKCIGLTTSIASLIASGGLNVLAYATLARTITSSIQDIKKLTTELDKLGKQIEKDVEALTKSVNKHPKLTAGKEVLNTMTFLTLGADVVNSHAAAFKTLATYKGRIATLQTKHAKLGKDVKKLMDKIATEKKKVDKTTKGKMVDLEKALDKLLGKTADMGAKFSENDALAVKLEKDLKALKGAKGGQILNTSKSVASMGLTIGKIVLNAVVLDAAGAGDLVVDLAEKVTS